MNEQQNCKNCGAILTGNKCEYCGTVYGDDEQAIYIDYGILMTPDVIEMVAENAKRGNMRKYTTFTTSF